MADKHRNEKYRDRWLVVDAIRDTTIYDVHSWGDGLLHVYERDARGNATGTKAIPILGEPVIDRINYKVLVTFKADLVAAKPLHRAIRRLDDDD